MSSVVDSNLERRISEHLDGELDDAQQAELFRALLRDPGARRLMDRYAEQDRLAASALRSAIIAPPRSVDRMTLRPQRRGVPWGQLAATAAVLAMAVGLWFVVNQTVTEPNPGSPAQRIAQQPPAAEPPATQTADDPTVEQTPDDTDQASASPTATASAVDQITGNLDETSMAIALTAAGEAGDPRWWRQPSVGPVENGRLIDHATTGPAIEGPQQRRRNDERAMIGVIDLTTNRMYWFKMQSSKTASSAADREL
jgi:hypothetical protein